MRYSQSLLLPYVSQTLKAVAPFAAVIVVICWPRVSQANDSQTDGPPGGYYQVEAPFNVENGHWQHHASTAGEGYYRGLSAYVQSLGVSQLNRAQANVVNEQAEWLGYENREKRVDSFYNRRRIRANYVSEQQEAAEQQREEGLWKLEQRRATRYRQAYSLSRRNFNPANGQIHWPRALMAAKFAGYRQQIEELFARRARYGLEDDAQLAYEIVQVERQLERDLSRCRRELARDVYLDAYKFLVGLKYEATYPAKLS